MAEVKICNQHGIYQRYIELFIKALSKNRLPHYHHSNDNKIMSVIR